MIKSCLKCGKKFIKLDDYTYKPSCECLGDVRISIG